MLVLASCEYKFIAPEEPSGPDPGEDVSFVQHVEPIFQGTCTGCHQDGGIGGFSLATGQAYASISSNGLAVAGEPDQSKILTTDHADSAYSDAEKELITQWINEGAMDN